MSSELFKVIVDIFLRDVPCAANDMDVLLSLALILPFHSTLRSISMSNSFPKEAALGVRDNSASGK